MTCFCSASLSGPADGKKPIWRSVVPDASAQKCCNGSRGACSMHVVDLIRKKRDGEALTDAEIAYLVAGAATNSIPEYQLAAWLMAVVWRGLNLEEVQSLTTHMRDSGRVLNYHGLPGVKVDKHST